MALDVPVVVYLHGFGTTDPKEDVIFQAWQSPISEKRVKLLAPCYHPNGDIQATRIISFLSELRSLALDGPGGCFAAIIGFSVGGLLAALFQDQHPELVKRVVLIGPAIDNFKRNFDGVPAEKWYMPASYVEELRALPARPSIRVPTLLLHGGKETDRGGAALWRVLEWSAAEKFEACYHPQEVGHTLDIVGASFSANESGSHCPDWKDLLEWVLKY
eukprot:TRINITY_DN102353_c0_g1_i1.p1 TRINITY_DN102353_c0_g1~~TRINITY_DN102353_c0_g1_i1.p1  ORF type:complete len:217 (+),score=45.27 TRINITY_DN102353_c0_g1_i1:166-816(+)